MGVDTFGSCFLKAFNNSGLIDKLNNIHTFLIILFLVILYNVKFHGNLNH